MKYLPCNLCSDVKYTKIRPYPGWADVDLVRCETCGLMQAQPMPSEAFLGAFYVSDFGNNPKQGFEMPDASERGFRLRAELQFDYIEKLIRPKHHTQQRILDVGCHAASFLSLFKRRGWDVTGLDPNPRSVYGERWYGIKVKQQMFSKGLFQEGQFDAILHSHALEHLRDPKATLREFFRLLKPGGWAFLEVPNESLKLVSSQKVIPHVYFFTPQTLERLAESVGFEIIKTRVLGIGPRKTKHQKRPLWEWLRLRWRARYNALGQVNWLSLLPFFGRFFREDRYMKDLNEEGVMLRTLIRRPLSEQPAHSKSESPTCASVE